MKLLSFETDRGATPGALVNGGGLDSVSDYAAHTSDFIDPDDVQLLAPIRQPIYYEANRFAVTGSGVDITTANEIGDPCQLAMKARINVETLCDNSSSAADIRFYAMIEQLSRGETLYPGELICSGPWAGVVVWNTDKTTNRE